MRELFEKREMDALGIPTTPFLPEYSGIFYWNTSDLEQSN